MTLEQATLRLPSPPPELVERTGLTLYALLIPQPFMVWLVGSEKAAAR